MKKKTREWFGNRHQLLSDYETREDAYAFVLDRLIKRVEYNKTEAGIRGLVKGRVKGFDAFYRKLLEKNVDRAIANPFEDIADIVGLRVVVPFLEDVHSIETLIKKSFDVLEVENKSRELSIGEFGYDSTHVTVEVPQDILDEAGLAEILVCEIQIRTILQDAWAEVEHELVYKTGIDNSAVEASIRRKLIALNATLSLADITFQELRDYQKKRAQDVQVRHQKLLDKVSTIPEKMALRAGGDAANMARDETAAGSETSESNTMFMEALDAHLDNRLERALELYTQILLETPNHYIYNHRGLVYFAMSDYRKAVDDFTAAIELQPGDTRVYTNRGLAYRMLREYESALADFERSIDINPFWADTFYGRALTHYDMGNVSAALADCDVAIDIKPGFKQVVRFKQFLLSIMQGA